MCKCQINIDIPAFFQYNKKQKRHKLFRNMFLGYKINRTVLLLQGGYFFMIRTITVTKKARYTTYSIISPPFTEVSKQRKK